MDLVTKLATEHILKEDEFKTLLLTEKVAERNKLFSYAQQVAIFNFNKQIYIRGLIEFTNHCQKDCFYCGLRCSNKYVSRYRLTKEQILTCCKRGYNLGFRTFVLQGGEDHYFTDDVMCDIISAIKMYFPDCAITLSIGERTRRSYQRLYDAGADRYLLRHETADSLHYSRLHPPSYKLSTRLDCLRDLKEIGFQVGAGFMVGAPYKVPEYLVGDFLYLKELEPAMIGIGPFIPQQDTPFRHQEPGSLEMTLRCIAILRLMFPRALIPATTALATLHPNGRVHGILSGANVIMPNLTPEDERDKYTLYDGKTTASGEAVSSLRLVNSQLRNIGYEMVVDRGDYTPELPEE